MFDKNGRVQNKTQYVYVISFHDIIAVLKYRNAAKQWLKKNST